ncbi:hypothetical protein [Chryseobacterium polytrichastri]|uniref:Uncharacterized protein n=1 Tax=Chryseobacterium polytrichastri TaxID=1302687 RepID=A0A1M6XVY0_9FLAO|nr:hypothetical protein [Chryseobacterium polytrichastri]SHL10141.1 hypothetical protein SAMN05444267_10127 [Chryseobacterium polytrichastri]
MKNFISLYLLALLSFLDCKKTDSKTKDYNRGIVKNDFFQKVKDTTLFINSSEGENVKVLINTKTQDSIIESEILGETGKSTYKFTFNKTLKNGECTTYRYSEPIYVNSNPKINIEKKENLSSSKESSNRLTNIFNSYLKVFLYQKNTYKSSNNKWLGKYSLVINKNDEDWRDIHEIHLNISKDSITYLAKGFQLYQYYLLSPIKKDNSIKLKYVKSLDNTESWALNKTKDFGTLIFDGQNYIWSCPYIDINFSNGKNKKYTLRKIQ